MWVPNERLSMSIHLNPETVCQDEQIAYLRSEWLSLDGEWLYENVAAQYEPGTIERSVFDSFTSELVVTHDRCLHCAGWIEDGFQLRLCVGCYNDDEQP